MPNQTSLSPFYVRCGNRQVRNRLLSVSSKQHLFSMHDYRVIVINFFPVPGQHMSRVHGRVEHGQRTGHGWRAGGKEGCWLEMGLAPGVDGVFSPEGREPPLSLVSNGTTRFA